MYFISTNLDEKDLYTYMKSNLRFSTFSKKQFIKFSDKIRAINNLIVSKKIWFILTN